MRLNMRSEAHSQLLCRIKHELTITPHDRSIDDHSGRLHILELTAKEVVLKSCVGSLRNERWCVVRWC